MSAAGDVVCEGWLRKSPPEKKLRRYAWKRRWFVLRSGRLSGEPDVLQYYKNQQSRRPIRTINLNLCEQVDAGLSFTKKELESSFVFDLRTEERTWYLVAESEEDMNRWVTSICLLCGFNPTDDGRTAPHQHSPPASTSVPPVAPAGGSASIATVTGSVPVSYEPVSVRPLEPDGSSEDDYLPLPPAAGDPASLGRQVPPPAHMGFRNPPLTPPLRRNAEATPPPIHRNLKPQRRVKPAPLDIGPVPQDWQEVPPPVLCSRLLSVPLDPEPVQSLRLMLHRASEGGVSSPLLRRARGDKQVEYLDLDLDPSGASEERARGERARVDYVVVDPKRTKALRNTREAWHDGRMSTEKDKA
uniref:PH domain-containing protein n=1 Tax=Stegastes partitus TaxID=144197 RepID=A0A3B5ADM8_9TELE